MNHTLHSRLRGLLLAGALAFPASTHAVFTVLNLPNLPSGGTYVGAALANLADGRFIYGTRNSLFEQQTFGLAPASTFTNVGALTWDPSSIAIFDTTHGVVSQGNGRNLYLFDPSSPGSSFTAIPGVSIQNFGAVYRDSTTLLVVGTNGTGGANAISSVKTNGTQTKVIIDNAGSYSGPIALDLAGNLYVTNAVNGNLYMFTSGEIAAATAGAAVNLTAGHFITTVRRTTSLAIDSLGRIVTGGYDSTNGFDVYNPSTGRTDTFAPADPNNDYLVSTFSNGTNSYIGFLDAGTTPGGPAKYGYDLVGNVPEPACALSIFTGALCLVSRRRRHAVLV